MKKKFGISLVFFGQKDSPYGYAIVDHKNKTVFKGGEFISIRELLLQFEDAPTRFAKIEQTIDDILKDNPSATTRDINRLLHRQFGTRIHRGTVSWNEETIQLSQSVKISSGGTIVSRWDCRLSQSESSIFHKRNRKRLHPRILLVESWMRKAVPVMLIMNTK
jgi:hypothetical protein